MFFTIQEIIDVLVMTFVVGFIFKDYLSANKVFNRPYKVYSSFEQTQRNVFWKDMKTAILIAAPAIILHEMGHKFVALAFGFQATFHAAYSWLVIALVLKLMNFGMIFIVPAYVSSACLAGSFCGGANYYLARSAISIAGPFVNFLLWIIPTIILKKGLLKKKNQKTFIPLLALTARINFFLMIFNMIPLPAFDGFHFFTNMFTYLKIIFGF